MLSPGDELYVGRAASVQFTGERALRFRVIRVDPAPTYHGWVWLDGYVLGPRGTAVERRRIFVQKAGLQRVTRAASSGSATSKRGHRETSATDGPATTKES